MSAGSNRNAGKMDYEKKISFAGKTQDVLTKAIMVILSIAGLLLCFYIVDFVFRNIKECLLVWIIFLLMLTAVLLIIIFILMKFKSKWNQKSEEAKEEKNQSDETETIQKWIDMDREDHLWQSIQSEIKEKGGIFFLWQGVVKRMGILKAEESNFLVHLGIVYLTALRKKNDNKKKHFALRKKAARYQNIKSFLQGLYNQKTIIAGVAGYVGTGALSVYASVFKEWIVWAGISVVIILIIALAGYIFLRSGYYDSEIELRKFGETWVRHEATVTNLENVMMQFVMKLGEFSCDKPGEGEKKKFMEQVGKVLIDNEEKFQKNMEKIE